MTDPMQSISPSLSRLPLPLEGNTEASTQSYRYAAAVLSSFDSASLRPLDPEYDDDSDALMDLLEECERVRDEKNSWRWMLKNSVRRQALKAMGGRDAFLRALEANTPRPDTALQHIFEACIAQNLPSIQEQSVSELTATLQVRDWLDGILPDLPDRETLTNLLEWQQLLLPFRQLVGSHFRGRTKEIEDVRAFIDNAQMQRSIYQALPLMIFGPGGVGKSTLLAKVILTIVDAANRDGFAFCYWDFERATLLPEEPVTLLAELALQLGMQFPSIKREAQELRQRWLGRLSESLGAQRTLQTKGGERGAALYRDVAQRRIHESRRDLGRYLEEFRNLIEELPRAHDLRLLLVLDTFERVQEVSFEFTSALWEFLNDLQSQFPAMRVIVAGRAPLSEEIAHAPYELKDLDEEAAKGYLAWRGAVNPQLADAIYQRVGGDPLSLRLTVDGLQQDYPNLSKLVSLPDDFSELSMDHELNQGWLYRRYLSRIPDKEIQRLAHPGLVLRRVTPELIQEVLAGPCKVKVPSLEVAEDLFERLARQASLVTREGARTLVHRQDVRKRMLRALLQTEGRAIYDIHRLAIDFYVRQPSNAAASNALLDSGMRAEEIYHRLFLDKTPEEIEARWIQGLAKPLRDAVDEVPLEMRSYLIAKLETTSATFNWDVADARSKEAFVATRARDSIAVNKLADALRILAEIRERLPGSDLYRLEAQTLERLGRYAEARIVANEGLFSARKANDAELELDLLLTAMRSNEILGQYERANELLDVAEQLDIKLPTDQAELLKIELQVHRLRLCRFAPALCGIDVSTLRSVVYTAIAPLFGQNTLLLLDAVEEIGVEKPEAVARALPWFPAVLEVETSRRQMARLLREWSEQGAQRNPAGDALMEAAEVLETVSPPQTSQPTELTTKLIAGLTQGLSIDAWQELFEAYFKIYAPSQPFVSGLVGLMRATLTETQSAATATSALMQQEVTALYSAFATRDALLSFLQTEVPELADLLSASTTYNEALLELASRCEQHGKTETLIARALAHAPDNALLQSLHDQLNRAVRRGTQTANDTTGVGSNSVSISGDLRDSAITTTGPVNIAGDVRDSSFFIYNRSLPREQLDLLPKQLPPFTSSDPKGPLWAAPELMINWALSMRSMTPAVCMVEAGQASGTGFLIAPNLLLSAHHLIANEDQRSLRFRFDYRHMPDGSLPAPTVYVPARDWLVAANQDLGYVLIRLEGTPGQDLIPGENAARGWLSLTAAPVLAGQGLFLLHHGLGGPQVLEFASARANDAGGVELATLSELPSPGAGGSPCCNERCQVVAVRIGTNPSEVSASLIVFWARDLLSDATFFNALKQHLPEKQEDSKEGETQMARLLALLAENFTFEELQELAAKAEVDWEQLNGDTRSAKALSLLNAVNKEGKLDTLVRIGMELRPSARWQ